ncbi:septum site-determining protein MinC [Salinibius halmophilus]|uniref:septum site-determining protein MinC n=1 Tax=Salinibius halmophilus TaxID=1853216 RepID=UPI0013143CB7|nr:septum site-determining protein MinC [Salinibius halmophilus]
MDAQQSPLQRQPECFSIKSGQVPFATIVLHRLDIAQFQQQLSKQVELGAGLLVDAPVVLDFGKLPVGEAFFKQVVQAARSMGLIIFAVRMKGEDLNASCQQLRVANLGPAHVKPAKEAPSPERTRIVRQVRSGQQIYARNTSLVIFGHVSDGAEVIADGDIYVHGNLRGKAMAGASGNTNAMIYCDQLHAQLVSINGIYAVNEKIPIDRGATLISLSENQLEFGDPQ